MPLFFLQPVGGFLQTSHFKDYLSITGLINLGFSIAFMVPAVLIKEIDRTVLWSWRKKARHRLKVKNGYITFFLFN